MTAKQRYDGNFLPRFQKDFQLCVIGNAATFTSRFPWLTAGAVYYICGYDTAITFPWWRDTTSPWLRFLCFLPRQICGERFRGINHGAAGIGEEKAKMLVSGSRIVICLLCNIQSRFRQFCIDCSLMEKTFLFSILIERPCFVEIVWSVLFLKILIWTCMIFCFWETVVWKFFTKNRKEKGMKLSDKGRKWQIIIKKKRHEKKSKER